MSVFDGYAKHYDLFYREKDYRSEAEYVARLIRQRAPSARRILELGCGTGKYGHAFVEQGCSVAGVDLSPVMIAEAEKRFAALKIPAESAGFSVGDIRSYRDGCRYDAVVALFHVMSYLTSNEDLLATLRTARAHLEPGGLFVFDCWYGPGVLSDPPKNPVKVAEDDRVVATRRTTSTLLPNRNMVRVHFDVDLLERAGGETATLSEDHEMRYLFVPEIEDMAARAGLKMIAAHRWLTEDEPDRSTWYALIMLEAI
jgi:SAM-dependent methyltransferase